MPGASLQCQVPGPSYIAMIQLFCLMNFRMVKNSIRMLSDCQIAKWAKSTSSYLHFLTDKKFYYNMFSRRDILFSATLPVLKSKLNVMACDGLFRNTVECSLFVF